MDFESNRFYRGLHIAEDDSKILLFASKRIIMLARNKGSINIQSDATFKTLPALRDAYQLFIVSLQVRRTVYPMMIAVMERKTTQAYELVFRCLNRYLRGTEIKKSFTDYEYAVINAVKLVFPQCEIRGCFFHFSKAVSRRAEKLGLYKLANDTNTIKCGINYATTLALLPADLISEGIAVVEGKLTNSLRCRNFISYLKRQWSNKPEVCAVVMNVSYLFCHYFF